MLTTSLLGEAGMRDCSPERQCAFWVSTDLYYWPDSTGLLVITLQSVGSVNRTPACVEILRFDGLRA